MRKLFALFLLLLLLQAGAANSLQADTGSVRSETVISDPIRVDRVYKSMQGPHVMRAIPISNDQEKVELLWLKKVALEFIDGKEDAPRPLNQLCHGHLLMDDPRVPALFTLIQGQNAVELPGNFAVPALSSHTLLYFAQIINLKETQEPFDLRVKATVDYIRDSDAGADMKPLYQMSMILKIPIDQETAAMVAENQHCSLASKDGSVEIVPSGSLGLRADSKGNAYSIHWNVPPGRHTYAYDLAREEIRANAGATIHFATIHLHPYGKSMELLDLTTNTSVFKIDVSNDPENGGIENVDSFYSEAGIPLYPDRRYRVTTEYDNPTPNSVDAMAILYLYVYDAEFERMLAPDRTRLSQRP